MFNHAIAYVMSVLAAEKRDEKGATAVEYALIIGLVSIVVVAAVVTLGPKIQDMVDGITF